MNRTPVLFRVDANPQQGWESFYRCLAFGTALQRRRRTAYFLSQLEPGYLPLAIKRAGNETMQADSPAGTPEDFAELAREVRRLRPAAVVIDSPNVDEEYLEEVKRLGVVVASMDSMALLNFPSRLVINPQLGPILEAYSFERDSQFLGGQRYAIVRPEIRRVRPARAKEPTPPYRALVALGDDDPNNQSGELAKTLLNCPKVDRVDIIVRPHHPQLEQLQAMVSCCPPGRLEVVSEPGDIPQRISRCHFAMTSGDSLSLELACVGVPQLVIVQDEKHWPTAQRLDEEGATACLGWHESVSVATIREAVQDVLNDQRERISMARCGRKLIDGRGLDRLVNALEVVLSPSQRVPLREAA